LFFLVWSMNEKDMFFLIGLGATAFLIGLGLILNALLFTVPRQTVPRAFSNIPQKSLIAEAPDRVLQVKRELTTAEPLAPPPSITEQTTHHLSDSPAAPPRVRESG